MSSSFRSEKLALASDSLERVLRLYPGDKKAQNKAAKTVLVYALEEFVDREVYFALNVLKDNNAAKSAIATLYTAKGKHAMDDLLVQVGKRILL